jgi:hypothetical protein
MLGNGLRNFKLTKFCFHLCLKHKAFSARQHEQANLCRHNQHQRMCQDLAVYLFTKLPKGKPCNSQRKAKQLSHLVQKTLGCQARHLPLPRSRLQSAAAADFFSFKLPPMAQSTHGTSRLRSLNEKHAVLARSTADLMCS